MELEGRRIAPPAFFSKGIEHASLRRSVRGQNEAIFDLSQSRRAKDGRSYFVNQVFPRQKIMSVLPIFIGYDTREDDAAKVCAHSLESSSESALHIQYLHEPSLRHIGLYTRQWTADGAQKFDVIDGKPFSTAFSFSRFLVPSLMQHRGWAIFVDCDFLFTADVARLFEMADPTKAVMVVKHQMPDEVGEKMDGQRQEPYARKNWSSLMLWNCSHPANQRLTPGKVNTMSGQWLHRFSWLDDDQIGELPQDWNWLAGVQPVPESGELPCAIHHTLGIPSMAGHENEPYADRWWAVLDAARQAGK